MTYIPKPKVQHPASAKNKLGLTIRDYEGGLSTLCAGCGHDSITAAIVRACWESEIDPPSVCKMSGIGCSSKTPGYFLSSAHGFNSVHGRMPSVTTGANAAQRDQRYLAVSGDGDTASIGIGQFMHAVRRRVNMLYIVENNGCYGLTKGQFSATADVGSASKSGEANEMEPIDPVPLAISMGAGFVARSFSGDRAQLVPLICAGLAYRGFALIDVISPCVTFNNHQGSTRSYAHVRESDYETGAADFVRSREEISVDYDPGSTLKVDLHSGDSVILQKLGEDFDPTCPDSSLRVVSDAKKAGKIATGLLYVDPAEAEMHDQLRTPLEPLRNLALGDLCPGLSALKAINNEHR